MRIDFKTGVLNNLLFNNLEKNLGKEFRCQSQPKLRAIVRNGSITLGVRTCVSGKRIFKKLGTYPSTSITTFKREAERYLGRLALEPSYLEATTLNQCFEELWKPYAKKQLKDVKTPLGRWSKHIAPSKLGNKKLSQISSIDIEQRLQEIAESGLSPATTNKIQMLLSKVFGLAVKHQLCPTNPCKGIKQRRENNTIKTVFTEKQTALFIKLATEDDSYHHARALLLSLYTGMRIGEVINLKLENAVASNYLDLKETKNGKPFRVFLNAPAQQLVKELKQSTYCNYLFPSNRNRNQPIAYPKAVFKRILEKMKQKGESLDPNGTYTIHMLRRTFSVLLHKKTQNIYAVSQALNHSSIATTQRYTSIFDDEMQENVNQLNTIFTS